MSTDTEHPITVAYRMTHPNPSPRVSAFLDYLNRDRARQREVDEASATDEHRAGVQDTAANPAQHPEGVHREQNSSAPANVTSTPAAPATFTDLSTLTTPTAADRDRETRRSKHHGNPRTGEMVTGDISNGIIPDRSISETPEQGKRRTRRTSEKQRTSRKVHRVYDQDAPIPANGHRIPYDSGLPFGGRVTAKIRLTDAGPSIIDADTTETPEQTAERVRREQRDLSTRAAFTRALSVPTRTVVVDTAALRDIPTEHTVTVEQITARELTPETRAKLTQMSASFERIEHQHQVAEGYLSGVL